MKDEELFSVCALVLDDKGNLLACSRRGRPNDLGLPGGKIDPGETPDQALARELREETGIEALEIYPIFERGEDTAGGRPSRTYYVHVFQGEPKSMEEGIEVSWVEPKRLLEKNCSFRNYNKRLFDALNWRP